MRRRSLLLGAAAAVGTAALPAAAKGQPPVFEQFHRSLLQVHGELREAVNGIIRAIADDAKDRQTRAAIQSFTTELLNHHKSEDSFFFPGFRAGGRMRTSDVAFLDQKDREHVDIHRACIELRDTNARRSTWRASVTKLITDISAMSAPHFAEEEATLTASHVATLITAAELVAIYRDMGKNWHRR